MSVIIAKIWQNGEFTVGFVSDARHNEPDHLGLSNASNSHTSPESLTQPTDWRKEARGTQNKFSSHARRMVRNAADLIGAKETMSFLTLTTPILTGSDEQLIRQKADVLIKVFIQWVKRRLVAAGLPGEIIAVREFQKRGALHWHLVFQGRRPFKHWAVLPQEFSAEWEAVLSRVIGRKVEAKAGTTVQRVRKSVSGYLSKYMSKSNQATSDSNDTFAGDEFTQPVGRAWNICHSLRKRITIVRSGLLGLAIWQHRKNLPFKWYREFEIDGVVLGACGQFKVKGEDVMQMLESSIPGGLSQYQE